MITSRCPFRRYDLGNGPIKSTPSIKPGSTTGVLCNRSASFPNLSPDFCPIHYFQEPAQHPPPSEVDTLRLSYWMNRSLEEVGITNCNKMPLICRRAFLYRYWFIMPLWILGHQAHSLLLPIRVLRHGHFAESLLSLFNHKGDPFSSLRVRLREDMYLPLGL